MRRSLCVFCKDTGLTFDELSIVGENTTPRADETQRDATQTESVEGEGL